MADDLKTKIDTARSSGHSDDDIAAYLENDPELGDKIKTAKGAGHSSTDIITYLSNSTNDKRGTQSTPPLNLLDQMKLSSPFVAGKDVAEGVGSGAAKTGLGLYNIGRKIMSGNTPGGPFNALPEAPAGLKRAADDNQYDPQGNPREGSTAFQLGKGAEQMGEYFIPGGIEADAAKGLTSLLGGTKLAEIASKAAMTGLSTGAIGYAQSGGDADAAYQQALTAGVLSGGFQTVAQAFKTLAPLTYKQGLSFPKHLPKNRIDEVIDDAIANRVQQTEGGAIKNQNIISARSGITDDIIANSGHANTVIPLKSIEPALQDMRDVATRMGDQPLLNKINKRLDMLYKAHGAQPGIPGTQATQVPSGVLDASGKPIMKTVPGSPAVPPVDPTITIGEAQQLKKDFQNAASSAYGKPNRQALNKAIAHGFLSNIESLIPEVKAANRDTQNSIYIQNAIENIIKKDIPGMSPGQAAVMLVSPPASATIWLLRNPRFRSALAIAMDRASKAGSTGGGVFGKVVASQLGPTPPSTSYFAPLPELQGQQ